jgi:hypothetical protein
MPLKRGPKLKAEFDAFLNFIRNQGVIPEKRHSHYIRWVELFLSSGGYGPEQQFSTMAIDSFLEDLGRRSEEWQVRQAADAIRLYRYF